jgi:hypothetical protein
MKGHLAKSIHEAEMLALTLSKKKKKKKKNPRAESNPQK